MYGDQNNFYMYMCTGKITAASEHRTRNPRVTSPRRYR